MLVIIPLINNLIIISNVCITKDGNEIQYVKKMTHDMLLKVADQSTKFFISI